ncbi:MAG: hypothetical protein ACD_10C00171G0004 [uncultured bacterium]|nr:MAG: hypothetical protein ACD_10C00171G0004 [uncultured bacterium]
MAQAGADVGHPTLGENGAGVLQNGPALVAHQLGALRVQFGQFVQQSCPRAQGDGAGMIMRIRNLTPTEDMDQFDRRTGALRYPGRMVADAGGVDGAVHEGDDFVLLGHDVCLPQCDIS